MQRDARLDICRQCEHNVRGRCRRAGRHVQDLARDPEAGCPDNRWPGERSERVESPADRGLQTSRQSGDVSNVLTSTVFGPETRAASDGRERRHLLYHVYPRRGNGIWQWNVDLLLHRIGLFDGRRIVAIAVDAETDSAADVMRRFGREVHEYLVVHNTPQRGEPLTFVPLLSQVIGDTGGLTFRAHAKGTWRAGQDVPHLQDWIDLLYRASLDDPPAVRRQLRNHAATGACRQTGRFSKGRVSYSGSFYWFRNAALADRAWWDLEAEYWAAESWPGLHLDREETDCLFLDDAGDLYDPGYWKRVVAPAWKKNTQRSHDSDSDHSHRRPAGSVPPL